MRGILAVCIGVFRVKKTSVLLGIAGVVWVDGMGINIGKNGIWKKG